MIKKLPLALLLMSASVFAQTESRPTCGTMEHLAHMIQENPQLEAQMQQYNAELDQWIAANANQRTQNAVITIPVVFHILYNTTAENIPDTQVKSQVEAMNADFMGTNADLSKVPAVYKSFMDNPQIQFCLAQRTPTGEATTGIIHKSTTKTSFSGNDAAKFSAQGGDDAWDTKKYFNIWICDLGASLLGYAEFPTGTATNTFGYVGHYKYTGTIGSTKPFHLGRTTTHEIGHCLNLRHIWGDADCGNDQVSDTPTQEAANSGCPTFPSVTCSNGPNGDMFMNYMDYSDDACMNSFTKGQVTRMLAVMNKAPYNALATSNGCQPPVNTAIGDYAAEASFSIYPNPSDGLINVSFIITDKSTHSLEVKNVLGQVVYKEALNGLSGNYSKSINIQEFGKGTYTITLMNDHNLLAKKIIIY